MEDLPVRVRHDRSTLIEAARWLRGTTSESEREVCSPASAEARLLPWLLGMCHGWRKTNLSSWQSSVGQGRTPRREAEFAKLGRRLHFKAAYSLGTTPPTPKPDMILKALVLLYKSLSDSEDSQATGSPQ